MLDEGCVLAGLLSCLERSGKLARVSSAVHPRNARALGDYIPGLLFCLRWLRYSCTIERREKERGFLGGFGGFLRFVALANGVQMEEGLPAALRDKTWGEHIVTELVGRR